MKTKLGLSVLMGILFFLFLVAFFAVSGAAAPGTDHKEVFLNAYDKLPLYFIENKGQLDPRVRFYVKTSGQTIYFTDKKIVFDLFRGKEAAGKGTVGTKKGRQNRDIKKERLVFNLGFENSRKGVLIEGLDRQDTRINYFVGNDKSKWKTGIATYKGVIYKGIYRGIDMKVFGNGKDMEYEFIVNPGGDPNHILLTYNGIERLSKNGKGELLIGTAFGELKETRPYIYQEIEGKKAVPGSFKIRPPAGKSQTGKFSYGFQIASYNQFYPLIIDPTLSYSTYLGGSDSDYGYGIAVDESGNAYVTGATKSSDFPMQPPHGGANAGNWDVFITKFSTSGNALAYSTYLGGSNSDYGYGIAVDGSGNVYITGETNSMDFPTQNPFQETHGGLYSYDAFIAKLSTSGNIIKYSSYLGGGDSDCGKGITVDDSGSAYVAGYTESMDFPTQNPFQETHGHGKVDAFITKVSALGNALAYSTYLGGNYIDYGYGIAVDESGNAYVAGITASSNFPTQNPFQGTIAGGIDTFISKLSPSGSALAYSTYLGGSYNDTGYGIAVDKSGNAYVVGDTTSSDFPMKNPYQGVYAGKRDAFITKVSASGNALAYSTYLGGSGSDYGSGIAVDESGNAYITGGTDSTNLPTQRPHQETFGGHKDAFISVVSTSGTALTYSTYLGGSGSDYGYGIAVDESGNAYITGGTDSTNLPTQRPHQETFGGGAGDAFVAKVSGTIAITTTPTPDIKANGSDGPIVISPGTSVSIEISLNPSDRVGHKADWWVAVKTPFDPPFDWYTHVHQSGWRPGIYPYAQWELSDVSQDEVLNMILPAGNYAFYFGIDDPDGAPTGPWWGLDSVAVTVQ